ncbi:MAG: ferritin-like domain-containing protein [Gammaproteobacteria bacterium]|nr:ferritin-like domain-containing protein [Gammaproteobacteria bacterium]NNM12799.1 ferritin-like domain-containing protein [Gammaproteobacteria bacterium]
MLYPELYKSLERSRWNMDTDIKWENFDASKLSDEQALSIKYNAITEWSALPATEMFLRDNQDDSDFSAFMSIWFYEEQKHSLVMMEYLRRFRPELAPTEEELHAVRFNFDQAPALDTLMMHFCGEIRLTNWYRCASQWHDEPVIKQIYSTLSADEARHASCYMRYMKRAVEKMGDTARASFAKMGVLMANIKTSRAMHPTNIHVNKSMFPLDTVQSKLPDPEWMEHWLDEQIKFGLEWQQKVSQAILRKLSGLLDESFESVRDLSRYRKTLKARLA